MELHQLRTLSHLVQGSPREKEKVARRRFLGEPPGGATTTKPLHGWSSGWTWVETQQECKVNLNQPLFHGTLITLVLMS